MNLTPQDAPPVVMRELELVSGEAPANGKALGGEPSDWGEMIDTLRREIGSLPAGHGLAIRVGAARLHPEAAGRLALSLFANRMPGGRLAAGHPVVLVDPDPATLYLAHYALETADGIGSVLLTSGHTGATYELVYIGRLEKHLRDALDRVARAEKPVTAKELAKRLCTTPTDAARRLGELYHNGLLLRSIAQGQEFAYRFFCPAAALTPGTPPSSPLSPRYRFFGGWSPWRAERFDAAAAASQSAGDLAGARRLAAEGLKLHARAADVPALIRAHKAAGDLALQQNDFAAAQRHYWERRRLARLPPRDPVALADAYHSLGWLLAEQSDDRCVLFYKRSVGYRDQAAEGGALDAVRAAMNALDRTRTVNNLSNVYAAWGDRETAHSYATKAILTRYQWNNLRGVASALFAFALHARVQEDWGRMVTLQVLGARAFAGIGRGTPHNIKRAVSEKLPDALAALGMAAYKQALEQGRALPVSPPVAAIEFAIGRRMTEEERRQHDPNPLGAEAVYW